MLGFDINTTRLKALREGRDSTASVTSDELQQASLAFSDREQDLKDRDVLIIAVPTPVDEAKRPDLTPFRHAAQTAGAQPETGCDLRL